MSEQDYFLQKATEFALRCDEYVYGADGFLKETKVVAQWVNDQRRVPYGEEAARADEFMTALRFCHRKVAGERQQRKEGMRLRTDWGEATREEVKSIPRALMYAYRGDDYVRHRILNKSMLPYLDRRLELAASSVEKEQFVGALWMTVPEDAWVMLGLLPPSQWHDFWLPTSEAHGWEEDSD